MQLTCSSLICVCSFVSESTFYPAIYALPFNVQCARCEKQITPAVRLHRVVSFQNAPATFLNTQGTPRVHLTDESSSSRSTVVREKSMHTLQVFCALVVKLCIRLLRLIVSTRRHEATYQCYCRANNYTIG